MRYKIIHLTVIIPAFLFCCSTQNKNDKEYVLEQKSFPIDTSFVNKATVESICPCKTTYADILKSSTLQPVDVENMEQGKKCIGSDDVRFVGNADYVVGKKGIIIQKDESSEYVAKIHLTKDFEGKLPNGQFVSIKT